MLCRKKHSCSLSPHICKTLYENARASILCTCICISTCIYILKDLQHFSVITWLKLVDILAEYVVYADLASRYTRIPTYVCHGSFRGSGSSKALSHTHKERKETEPVTTSIICPLHKGFPPFFLGKIH